MFRPGTVDPANLYATSHPVRVRVDAWRGDVYGGRVPVLAGDYTEQADQFVSGTLDLSVPGVDPVTGRSWVPVDPLDPLNSYGQRLYVEYDAQRPDGQWVTTPLGWFLVDEWSVAGDGSVSVSALDLRDTLRTAELLSPIAPRPAGTFVSELRRLVGSRLPLDVTAAPADRAVPSGMSWQESRVDAIAELLTAWPARADLDPDGVLVVTPDTAAVDPADVQLVEGSGGVVVQRTRAGSRAGIANIVVARGDDTSAPNAPAVVGYASDTTPGSPTDANGPYGHVVHRFASPLLRTRAQAETAAATILRRLLRPARLIPVQMLPDPRLGVGTRVGLTLSDGDTVQTVVMASQLPLTGAQGAQALTLAVIPGA